MKKKFYSSCRFACFSHDYWIFTCYFFEFFVCFSFHFTNECFFFNFWHWRIRFSFFDFLIFNMLCVVCWSLSRFFCIFRRSLTWSIRKFELTASMFRCYFKWRSLIILLARLFSCYFLVDSLTCDLIRKSCFFFLIFRNSFF